MSADDLAAAVRHDLAATPWSHRLQTMLLATALVALGWLLGVEFAMTAMSAELGIGYQMRHPDVMAAIGARYQQAVLIGAAGVGVGGLGAVGLEVLGGDA